MLEQETEMTVTIPLSPELLNSLHRRRWRHLRGIEKTCKASIRLDRANSTLLVSGTEESVAAVKHRLAGLNGPRRMVSTAVWAELMRTRTLQDSRQSVLMRLQEESGCRIHIERSSREVRIFGTEADVQVAEQLLDDLDASVTEAALDIDVSLISELVLESLMHSRGVMVQVEGGSIKIFGKKDAVSNAVEDIREYVANPHSNRLLEVKAKMPPHEEVTPARPVPTSNTMQMSKQEAEQQGGQAMAKAGMGQSCHTCGAANFCPCCGNPVWSKNAMQSYAGGNMGVQAPQKEAMMQGQMGGYQLVGMPGDIQSMGSSQQYMPVQYIGGQAMVMVPQGMVLQMQNADNAFAYTMHGSYGA